MATHSRIPAWKIPWTEEPSRLQSTGLQRVGHDWATPLHFASLCRALQFNVVLLVYFCFFYSCFWCHIQKKKSCCQDQCQRTFPLCCLLGCLQFQILHLSLMHFKLIFVHGVRLVFNLIFFLHVNIWFSQYHLLKRLFSFESSWLLYEILAIYQDFLFCSTCLCVCFFINMPVPCYFDYHRFIIYFDIQKCDPSSFVLSPHFFGYLG